MTYSEKLRDPRWQKLRLQIMERDGFICTDCTAKDKPLHIHHCLYEKGNPWDTHPDFLKTLCEDCHDTRQSLENDGRRALGMMFSRVGQDGLHDLVTSLVQGAGDKENCADPIIVNSSDHDYLSEWRWFRSAIDNPEFRPFYEHVTGRTPNWEKAEGIAK